MKIVLMADNSKNELLVNFCIAYRPLLSKHQLISVYNTGKLLKSAVDLDVSGLSLIMRADLNSLLPELSSMRSTVLSISVTVVMILCTAPQSF